VHTRKHQLRGAKMSKSLGNLIPISDFLAQQAADVLRLAVLSSHYRKPLGFDDGLVADAGRALQRLLGGLRPPAGDEETGDAADLLQMAWQSAERGFHAAMLDDFNTAGALGHLFTLTRAINTARDAGIGGQPFARAQAGLYRLAHVLGLELRVEAGHADVVGFIDALVRLRTALRREQQWALADQVRDELAALEVMVEDGAQGTTWRWA
jgi:cysteinyl-tRNA synthetase